MYNSIMEVILITPNPKYQTLVSPAKTIESSIVDIGPLVEAQVFLNHHSNLSLFCLRNNFAYQFHCPLQICNILLQRNQSAVELYISNGQYYKIDANDDHVEVLSGIQAALQDEVAYVGFTVQSWEVQVKFVVVNEIGQQSKVREAIKNMEIGRTPVVSPHAEVGRIVLFVDENNYEDFLNWSQNQTDFYDFELKERLTKEYMSLKQQIDNEKNLFRNKIKMVETVLGQNINIDKLLTQDKQENQEYKRLKETFQTIKNIDNVIIEQQKRIEFRKQQLKQKVQLKHTSHYENAKKFAKAKAEIAQLAKQNQQLQYTIDRVKQDQSVYNFRRNFQLNPKTQQFLVDEVTKCKQLAKSISSFYNPHSRNLSGDVSNGRITQSVHSSAIKTEQKYRDELRKKIGNSSAKQKHSDKEQIQKTIQEMGKYEKLLVSMVDYFEKNNQLLAQIQEIDYCSQTKTKLNSRLIGLDPSEFIILQEILEGKQFSLNVNENGLDNMNQTNNYIGSAYSIGRKNNSFVLLEQNRKSFDKINSISQISQTTAKNSPASFRTKMTEPTIENSRKLIKTKIKPTTQSKQNKNVQPRR